MNNQTVSLNKDAERISELIKLSINNELNTNIYVKKLNKKTIIYLRDSFLAELAAYTNVILELEEKLKNKNLIPKVIDDLSKELITSKAKSTSINIINNINKCLEEELENDK